MKIDHYTTHYKNFILLSIIFLILVDLGVIFNLGVVRQILGVLFLSILPGLILTHIFRLNIRNLEKIVLSVGLSIATVLFVGVLTNQILLFIGYARPLSVETILAVYNILIPVLLVFSYMRNKSRSMVFDIEIKSEHASYYIIPLFFPVMSIMGSLLINNWNINTITLILLLLIPVYVLFLSIRRSKIPSCVYPYTLFFMGIALLLLYALRSNNLIFGADTDWEYYLFSTTLSHGYWMNFTNVTYDSCISISILPVIYQKLSGIAPESLFRILYPLLFSVSPLIVYSIAKKYLTSYYSFLASFFFISFYQFFTTNNRIDVALIFFGLTILVMFNTSISRFYKKALIIIFLLSIVLSHYSTGFITFFILFLTYIITFSLDSFRSMRIFIPKYGVAGWVRMAMSSFYDRFKNPIYDPNSRMISFSLVLLLFAFIFLWDGIICPQPFTYMVQFVNHFVTNIYNITNVLSSFQQGNSVIHAATGQSSYYLGTPGKIELTLSWIIVALSSLGVLLTVLYKLIPLKFLKNPFKEIDAEFTIMALVGVGILVISFLSPFISTGYNILRTFFQMLFMLDVFFVLGAFFVVNFLRQLLIKKDIKLPKKLPLILLLCLMVPYFTCTTGTMYQLFHVDRSIALNNQGKEFDDLYIHQQEIFGAQWLKTYGLQNKTINTDYLGRFRVIIGGLINPLPSSVNNNINQLSPGGYVYLRYFNVVNQTVLSFNSQASITSVPLQSYNNELNGKSRIYDNGGSQVLL